MIMVFFFPVYFVLLVSVVPNYMPLCAQRNGARRRPTLPHPSATRLHLLFLAVGSTKGAGAPTRRQGRAPKRLAARRASATASQASTAWLFPSRRRRVAEPW